LNRAIVQSLTDFRIRGFLDVSSTPFIIYTSTLSNSVAVGFSNRIHTSE